MGKNYGVWVGTNHGSHGFSAQYGLTVSASSKKDAKEIAIEILNTCVIDDLKGYAMTSFDEMMAETNQNRGFDRFKVRVELI